jgi:hypothetical protein
MEVCLPSMELASPSNGVAAAATAATADPSARTSVGSKSPGSQKNKVGSHKKKKKSGRPPPPVAARRKPHGECGHAE